MRKTGFILLVIILCSLATIAEAKAPQGMDESMVREYFNGLYPHAAGVAYPVTYEVKEIPWLAETVHGAVFFQAYAGVFNPPASGTFIAWKGRTYTMPGEFNTFVSDAKIKIRSEEDALGLAELYASGWEPSGTEGAPPVITIRGISDIPQKGNPVKRGNIHTVTEPQVKKKDALYVITLYTWSPLGGFLREWHITVDYDGAVTGENALLDQYVGDCEVEGALAEAGPFPALAADGPAGRLVRNVVIGSETPFAIHWRPDDFIPGTADSDVDTVVNWVETAARTSWQRIVVDGGLERPLDQTIDIYICNDTNAGLWGPQPWAGGVGAYCSPPYDGDGNQAIYVMDHQVGWWTPMGVYYPSSQDAYTATVAHEYLHAVQWRYKIWTWVPWIGEGSARMIPTYVITADDGEFWQGASDLAGLAGGPYNQDATHRSKYIRESMGYFGSVGNSLSTHSYDMCVYWRYLLEERGISVLEDVYLQVQSSDPQGNFPDQVTAANAGLGTTDLDFPEVASAIYREFSPFAFARDDDFFDSSDTYYNDVSRETIALTTASSFPVTDSGSVGTYGVKYYDVDPGNVRHLRISFNGNDADSFSVIAFKGQGSTADEVTISLDGNKDGSVDIHGADALDVVGLMIAHIDTSGTGSYTLRLENLNQPPVAEANGAYNGVEGSPVTFDATGSSDPDGDPLQYRWSFDCDGTATTGWVSSVTVDHTFPNDCTGTATLEVTDGDATDTDTAGVTITNFVPVVNGGPDDGINEGQTFARTGSFTDPGADTWTATVDYGDGSGVQALPLKPDKTFSLSHLYTDNLPGDAAYTVTITVMDGAGSGTDTVLVTVHNVPPSVDGGPGAEIDEGLTFIRPGSFTDPGADTWTATVDYGDGSGAQPLPLKPDKTFTLSHAYGDNGVYPVIITVTDDDGATGTDTVQVTVTNVAPTVTKGAMDQPNPQFILPKVHKLTFHGTFSDPGWLDSHTTLWSFGDSSTDPGTRTEENAPPDATGTVTATHAYNAPGDYIVTVTVTDDDGGATTSDAWTVHVADVVEAKHDLAMYIQSLPADAFKGNDIQRKNALANKIVALDDMITRMEWKGFITSIVSDVRTKADGSVDGKSNDDWIKDRDAQSHICMKIDDIVAYVKTFM